MAGRLTILTPQEGDQTLTWDPVDELTTAEVRRRFDELVRGERWLAYAYPAGGGAPVATRVFDPQAAEIVLSPQLVGG